MVAEKRLPTPKKVEQFEATLNKAVIGKQFKQNAKPIAEYFANIDASELEGLAKTLESDGYANFFFLHSWTFWKNSSLIFNVAVSP